MKFISGLFILTMMFTAACTTGPTAVPDQQSAEAQLYIEKCGTCHSVPHPGRNTAQEWQHLFALMEQRMAERDMPAFTAEEKTVLQNYLQDYAR